MMPSIATKSQYVNSPLYFFLLTTCFGPYRPSSGEIYNWCLQGLFLLQRNRCTYTTWHVYGTSTRGKFAYYLTIWINGSVATNSNSLLDILCYKEITWRWPLVKAETCRVHREHEIKHILLIVANEGFVLWFDNIYIYIYTRGTQK
jgi:hypothetical protein